MKFFAWNCKNHQWLQITDIGDLQEIPEGRGDIVSVRRYSEPDKVLEAAKLTWLRLFGQYEQRIYRLVELCGTAKREEVIASVAAGDSRNVCAVTRSLNGLLDKRALFESHGDITCNPIVPLATVKPQQKASTDTGSPYRVAAEWALAEARKYPRDPEALGDALSNVLYYELATRRYADAPGTLEVMWPAEKRPPLIPPPSKGKRDRRRELIMRELAALKANG